MGIQRYVWADTEASYQELARGCVARGTVPLLAPSDEQRRSRWSEVLAWYGLADPEPPSERVPHFPPDAGFHPVVAIDDEFAEAARLYADACGRPYHALRDGESLEQAIPADCRSVLLVGLPRAFGFNALAHLAQQIPVPWGMLTARDLPGITFTVAKLLAAEPRTTRGLGIIDADSGRIQTADAGGQFRDQQALAREPLYEALYEQAWQDLVFLAHGEGGHLYLYSAALCGLVGDVEQGAFGPILDGCRRIDGQIRCKRVHDPEMRVLSYGDIRTRNLYLFSCSSFPVMGEPYLSTNISGVLAASDGYPAAVVATDRILHMDSTQPTITAGLRSQHVGLGSLVSLLNDLYAGQAAIRPFVLFGDPYGGEITWTNVDHTASVTPLENTSVTPIQFNNWTPPRIVGTDPPIPDGRLVLGLRSAALIVGAEQPAGEVRLTDQCGTWESKHQWLQAVGQRLPRAGWFERAIPSTYPWQLSQSADFRSKLDQLWALREKLEQLIQAALRACERSRRLGVWDETIADQVGACGAALCLWDLSCAELMLNHLLLGMLNIFDTSLDGLVRSEGRSGAACEYCHCPLIQTRATDPLQRAPARMYIFCPTCGDREIWRLNEARVKVQPLSTVRSGQKAEIKLRIVGDSASAVAPVGQLLVQVVDKGTGQVVVAHRQTWRGGTCTVPVLVPDDLSPELHTVWVGWVRALDFALLRLRWASY